MRKPNGIPNEGYYIVFVSGKWDEPAWASQILFYAKQKPWPSVNSEVQVRTLLKDSDVNQLS